MTSPIAFSVSTLDVALGLLRLGLGADVSVASREPDDIPAAVPLVVVRRTGGASFAPRFWDEPFVNVMCWAEADRDGLDAARAAEVLADRVRRVLWDAWSAQTVTAGGHIARLRESQGPEESPDRDLPHHGRYTTTYEIKVRRSPTA